MCSLVLFLLCCSCLGSRSAFILLDALQGVFQGVLRGTGRQVVGVGVTVVGYYMIQLPLAYTLAFPAKLQLLGLWLAMVCAYVVINMMFTVVVSRLRWQQAAELAHARALHGSLSAATVVDDDHDHDNDDDGDLAIGGGVGGGKSVVAAGQALELVPLQSQL